MSDKETPIGDLTKLMLFFGRVPETHIENLKAFPFIYFNDVKEVKLDYIIGTKKDEESLILYDLNIEKENDHLEKRYKALESAIRTLFWKEIKLKLSLNGKEVYKSE